MKNLEQSNLKISVVSTAEANKSIEEMLYKCIARVIFNNPDFRENLLLVKQVS